VSSPVPAFFVAALVFEAAAPASAQISALPAASGGQAHVPGAGDPPLSVMGNITGPTTLDDQVWYRNAVAFCTPSTFNLTHGLEIVWTP
jgi:hypothetical protein